MSDVQDNKPSPEQELILLKERADMMGIAYHPSIGVEKLKAKIDAKLTGIADTTDESGEAAPEAPVVAAPLSEYAKNKGLRDDSLRLIRVVVNCMNPAKQAWEGEIFTVSNRVIGTVRKYVPFNLEAGYHIPYAIFEQLQERRCQTFFTHTDTRTKIKTRKGKLIKEFNLVIMPPLTEAELNELATQQAVSNSID